jgi:Lysozyme inhibitor LprI
MKGMMLAIAALGACLVAPLAAAQSLDQATVPLWRRDTSHLSSDRMLIRACLDEHGLQGACHYVVQETCITQPPPEGMTPFGLKRCDWRAIAAWEDEMDMTLAQLRAALPRDTVAQLNESQRLWEQSVLADVTLAVRIFAGGNISGPVGASARSQSTASRTVFLRGLSHSAVAAADVPQQDGQ